MLGKRRNETACRDSNLKKYIVGNEDIEMVLRSQVEEGFRRGKIQ